MSTMYPPTHVSEELLAQIGHRVDAEEGFFIPCSCGTPEHVMYVYYDSDLGEFSLQVGMEAVHTPSGGWRRRLGHAWAFLLGRPVVLADTLLSHDCARLLAMKILAHSSVREAGDSI